MEFHTFVVSPTLFFFFFACVCIGVLSLLLLLLSRHTLFFPFHFFFVLFGVLRRVFLCFCLEGSASFSASGSFTHRREGIDLLRRSMGGRSLATLFGESCFLSCPLEEKKAISLLVLLTFSSSSSTCSFVAALSVFSSFSPPFLRNHKLNPPSK